MGTMNGDTMTFPALTLPTTAPMTDNVLKQRAAQKLATDWKPVHEFLLTNQYCAPRSALA